MKRSARTVLACAVAATLAARPDWARASAQRGSHLSSEEAGNGEASAPSEPSVESLTQQAVEAFGAKRYDEAIALFEQAYELDAQPNLLFNIGRVYEETGDLQQAVEYYRRFIKQPNVTLDSRKLALDRLRVLEELLAATQTETKRSEPPQPPPPATVSEPSTPAEVTDRAPVSPLRSAGWALFGVGLGAAAVGGGLGGAALAQKQRLDAATEQLERREASVRGRRFAIASDVLISVGASLAVTGIILAAISYRRPRTTANNRVRWDGGLGVQF